MVNWKDPAVQLDSAHAAGFVTALSLGIFLWEFFVCLGFDWTYLSGARPFRWTLVPYLTARISCVIGSICLIIISNMFTRTESCKAWWHITFAMTHIGLQSSSLLLVIRVIAISEKNRLVIVGLGSAWLAELGTSIHSVVLIKGAYVPQLLACGVENTHVSSTPYMLASLGLHVACFALVPFLLLRSPGAGLWRLLISGIVYFTVSMVAHTSSSVILLMDLNEGMNLALITPSAAALVICSTRMYRGLIVYGRADLDEFTLSASIHFKPSDTQRTAASKRRSITLPQHFNMYGLEEEDTGKLSNAPVTEPTTDDMSKTTLGGPGEVCAV